MVRSSTLSSAAIAATGTIASAASAPRTAVTRHRVANLLSLAFMSLPSTLVLGAGRMIRAVDHHVAVQARPRIGLRTRALVGERVQVVHGRRRAVHEVGAAVDRRAVVAAMAFLAEPRHASLQQRRGARAVRLVAV